MGERTSFGWKRLNNKNYTVADNACQGLIGAERAIIVLACIIVSVFAASRHVGKLDVVAVTMVWSYVGELVFKMLVLVGVVKRADCVVRKMMGLKKRTNL